MKNNTTNVLKAAVIMAAIISMPSCMNNAAKNEKELTEVKNEQHIDTNDTKTSAQFLFEVSEINREEISLGQLAQQKGNSSHVKALGKMMVDEHSKLSADLDALAERKNISLQTSNLQNTKTSYNVLNEKSGNDFGKEYSGVMVNGHKTAIALFENASVNCTDPEIRAWAEARLPALKKHLEQSLICQKQCESMSSE